jgi:hypothetical protein
MANRRPYMTYNIDQLEQLAEKSRSDLVLKRDLILELESRKNSRAKALKKKLEEGPAAGAAIGAPKSRASASGGATRKSVSNPETVLAPRLTEQAIIDDLELLRQTFTESAEILSRWGMTESMPEDLRDLVFASWAKRLAKASLPHGRTILRLKQDQKKLDAIIDSRVKPASKKQRGEING